MSVCTIATFCGMHFLSYNSNPKVVKISHSILGKMRREKDRMSKIKISGAMDDSSITTKRPLANFHSSVWGNFFLSYTPQLTV